jgi:carboxypeptidase C (cathepsin A)
MLTMIDYYNGHNRGTYDIRHTEPDPTPEEYYIDMLNTAAVQQAIGVDTNYTSANDNTYYSFQATGDFVYPNFIEDIEELLNNSVRVTMVYGDADYICNWFGGEAVSKQIQYAHSAGFAKAGYVPFMVVCDVRPCALL